MTFETNYKVIDARDELPKDADRQYHADFNDFLVQAQSDKQQYISSILDKK